MYGPGRFGLAAVWLVLVLISVLLLGSGCLLWRLKRRTTRGIWKASATGFSCLCFLWEALYLYYCTARELVYESWVAFLDHEARDILVTVVLLELALLYV